jgi:hypothetical protein
MCDKSEKIKELQNDLFVEEYGVTKYQARKLNEFLFHESTGKGFNFFAGMETPNPSVCKLIDRLQKQIDEQSKRISNLEWEHKKLWLGSFFFGMLVVVVGVVLGVEYFK